MQFKLNHRTIFFTDIGKTTQKYVKSHRRTRMTCYPETAGNKSTAYTQEYDISE